jgi:hypothetical protein
MSFMILGSLLFKTLYTKTHGPFCVILKLHPTNQTKSLTPELFRYAISVNCTINPILFADIARLVAVTAIWSIPAVLPRNNQPISTEVSQKLKLWLSHFINPIPKRWFHFLPNHLLKTWVSLICSQTFQTLN